jgi:hypothetical protein
VDSLSFSILAEFGSIFLDLFISTFLFRSGEKVFFLNELLVFCLFWEVIFDKFCSLFESIFGLNYFSFKTFLFLVFFLSFSLLLFEFSLFLLEE